MFSALTPFLLLLAWQPWFSARGVAVEIVRVEGGVPWIRGTGEIPAPAEKLEEVVSDFKQYRQIFAPALKESRVLESDDDSARLHLVWPYPFPLRSRDAIVSYRMEKLPEGGFLLSWKNDAKPGDPRSGVRIARVSGEARIEPLGPDRSRVTYTYLGDLGASFRAPRKRRRGARSRWSTFARCGGD